LDNARAPFDRRVGNPNVTKDTVAPWSFLSSWSLMLPHGEPG